VNVEGAAALVTGANRGLGAAIAQALVDAGAAGFIDTDMAAGIDAEKISPQSVAAQIVAAIEADAEEVLADPTSELVKASLSNDLTTLYPTLQAQWDAVAVSR
jgi:NAD(P)-dependent dehydrogenase (short-subunit alcohol dehydrogenase family)